MKPEREDERRKRLHQELLVIRANRGDDQAFEEIVRSFEFSLFYYVRRAVETDADAWDLMQEIWIKAFRGISSLRETKRFRVWLYRIAHCATMGYHRAAYRSQAVVKEAADCEFSHEADPTPDPADAEWIHLALDQLEPGFREILALRFLEDLSVEETAEVLNVPAGTVKSRLFHAKKALRKVLNKVDKL